jgi:hypothetical protein
LIVSDTNNWLNQDFDFYLVKNDVLPENWSTYNEV